MTNSFYLSHWYWLPQIKILFFGKIPFDGGGSGVMVVLFCWPLLDELVIVTIFFFVFVFVFVFCVKNNRRKMLTPHKYNIFRFSNGQIKWMWYVYK